MAARSRVTGGSLFTHHRSLDTHRLLDLIQCHPNGFDLGIGLDGVRTHLASEATLLIAAERRGAIKAIIGVEPSGYLASRRLRPIHRSCCWQLPLPPPHPKISAPPAPARKSLPGRFSSGALRRRRWWV